MTQTIIIPVILCGGSGTRLWPASRDDHPKQFLSLMDDFSLLQNTMRRALRVSGAKAEHVVTVTIGSLAGKVREHLAEIDPAAARHILPESSARNTAAAVALAAVYIKDTFGDDAVMWVLPADHHIGDEDNLAVSFRQALEAAQDGYLVTFGIQPTRPDTGYGYIQMGDQISGGAVHKAARFVEKPDRVRAQTYLDSGDYLWNSGMFLFEAGVVLEQYRAHAADVLAGVENAVTVSGAGAPDAAVYDLIAKVPFDVSIMEKSDRVAIVPCDPEWSDIGSWDSLWDIRKKDIHGNVVEGVAACFDTKNCLIQAQDRLIACAGLENIVIVESGGAILVADRSNAEAMKILVGGLKKSNYAMKPPADAQPWAMTKPVNQPSPYRVREFSLAGGEEVNCQKHAYQSKFWTVSEGRVTVRIGNEEKKLEAQNTVFIPAGTGYSISNMSADDVRVVEVIQDAPMHIRFVDHSYNKAA